ncbi:MAG: NUDIX hydrolase [Candidatus Dormibacteraeota bacterium]|nr:NUDIX hydrolase [Candidatus Dormibacteraeota bacterium]
MNQQPGREAPSSPSGPPATMHVTVDIVLERQGEILLVRRRAEPFAGDWALPGGFVEADEDLPQAALRELAEETGLNLAGAGIELSQLGAYGRPGRDPRGRTVSIVFMARVEGDLRVTGGDDAAEARFHPVAELPSLAFDHATIVADGLAALAASGAVDR